jgi:hypothetical protein
LVQPQLSARGVRSAHGFQLLIVAATIKQIPSTIAAITTPTLRL